MGAVEVRRCGSAGYVRRDDGAVLRAWVNAVKKGCLTSWASLKSLAPRVGLANRVVAQARLALGDLSGFACSPLQPTGVPRQSKLR